MRRSLVCCWMVLGLVPALVSAQEFKVEVLKEVPPTTLAEPVKQVLEMQGYRILLEGKAHVDIWLRKSVPATAKPAGPTGSILYPSLTEGELIGVARYASDGQDYRDQVIAPGLYTMRYGLRLDDGNHANVSPYKDYALLLPAAKDGDLAPITAKTLHKTSALAAGTTHPAVLNLGQPPSSTASALEPAMSHEEAENVWGLVVPLKVAVAGESNPFTIVLNLIVAGASAG